MKRCRSLLLAGSCALSFFSVLMMLRSLNTCDLIIFSCGGNNFVDICSNFSAVSVGLTLGLQGRPARWWTTSPAGNLEGVMMITHLNGQVHGSHREFLGVGVSESSRGLLRTTGSQLNFAWSGGVFVKWRILVALFAAPPAVWLLRRLIRRTGPSQDPDARPCQTCGYDLRGQKTPRCPECGTPFEASNSSERRPAMEYEGGS